MLRFRSPALLLTAATLLLGACAPEGATGAAVSVAYHEPSKTLRATVPRGLEGSQTLHLRLRRGSAGELDCASMAPGIERIDTAPVTGTGGPTYQGPAVEDAMLEPMYDTSWLEGEPTAEMLAAVSDGSWMIDVCLMEDGAVVEQQELDLLRALDRPGSNGKFDGDEEERIASTTAYAERCVADLGEIPFFEKLEDGDYATYNCLDSTPIPTTVTTETGVELPETQVSECDEPQYIYSLCEPNAVDGRTNGPRVASRTNEQGTEWVLLCRKAKAEEGAYNDIAMIGHNPYTGRTCFFQNALYSRTDGLHVPHPGDKVDSERSPQQSETLWNGIHGGLGSGIQCAECHDADPFIHTPWIDGALDQNGDPVVPKMGVDDDFALGFVDAPYTIVNTAGQGWTMPEVLVSEEAAPCTRCHRIGSGRWSRSWIERLRGTDESWTNITTEAYRSFEHTFWMPPSLDGLDEESWPDSEYAQAMEFIEQCGNDRSACDWEPLPTSQLVDVGEPPTVDLEGVELATESLKILGANVSDPDDPRCEGPEGSCETRRCAECHSVSRSGLRHWADLTRDALAECGLDGDPEEMSPEEAVRSIDCLRVDPRDPGSVFAAEKLGILTTGVQYGYFRKLFRKAYGEDGWLPQYLRFRARVSMPKGNHPELTQLEFVTLEKWFGRRLESLEDVIEDPPPPESCEPGIDTAAVTAHADEMRYEGWGAVNEEAGMRMYGCDGDNPYSCFLDRPNRSPEWGTGAGVVREVHELGFRTSFWMRSSADGRFVGNGGGNGSGATITDLLRGVDIAVSASYDPGFFPDNSGFIFQGGGAGICAQSLLETATEVTFEEPQCIRASGINLYQHVARGLSGGDYFIINSQFTSDSGGASSDPSAHFNASSTMKLTPMIFDGTTYDPMDPVIVDSPYEGDSVLSPSSNLVISRLAGPNGRPLGYVVRRVQTSRFGDAYRADISEVLGTYCLSGAKANISFDERFFVTHQYDEETANIVLVDMLDGSQHQVTDMPPEAEALFPHFRSDGWIYFLVRTDDGGRYVVASDAALKIAAGSR